MEIKARLHLDEISATLLATRGRMFDKANAILKTWYHTSTIPNPTPNEPNIYIALLG